MPYNSGKHHRCSVRLKEHDYSQSGAYFITICTYKRECLFGEIVDGEMQLNEFGGIVATCWNEVPRHFKNVQLDAFITMPNHVHGIVIITNDIDVGAGSPRPYNKNLLDVKHTLGQIVVYFKYQWSKRINKIPDTPTTPLWQRNYYEHIIRNDETLNRIREYILTKPLSWHLDRENPLREGDDEFDRWFRGQFKIKGNSAHINVKNG